LIPNVVYEAHGLQITEDSPVIVGRKNPSLGFCGNHKDAARSDKNVINVAAALEHQPVENVPIVRQIFQEPAHQFLNLTATPMLKPLLPQLFDSLVDKLGSENQKYDGRRKCDETRHRPALGGEEPDTKTSAYSHNRNEEKDFVEITAGFGLAKSAG
jgi:hypothetical protein